jgi:hypothetical protein
VWLVGLVGMVELLMVVRLVGLVGVLMVVGLVGQLSNVEAHMMGDTQQNAIKWSGLSLGTSRGSILCNI